MLFGVERLQVTDAQALPDGTLEVWAVTADPAAAACPDCGRVSGRRHDTVLARPRDVRRGGDPVAVWWVKCRWKCEAPGCARKTFTERVPQVPPRFRLITRQAIRRGTFTSVKELINAIEVFIDGWNDRCEPFVWTKTADEVLAKAKPRQKTSNTRH